VVKRKNQIDATLRNTRAANKRLTMLEARVSRLEEQIAKKARRA
jgi:hypothetical protein